MKAPESPPTLDEAIAPPFLTASVSSASAAVVPGAPVRSRPINSRMSATESPIAGVGARLMSTMPKACWPITINRIHSLPVFGGRALCRVPPDSSLYSAATGLASPTAPEEMTFSSSSPS